MSERISLILDEEHIEQKIRRIAYQILEDHCDETELIIAGVCEGDEGYYLAEKILRYLTSIAPDISIKLAAINLDKNNPNAGEIEFGLEEKDVKDKVIILVDDVANSGRTLVYALKPILRYNPKTINVAVLVDRTHKRFPISADYVGLSLATTIQEHITVNLKENIGVYLS